MTNREALRAAIDNMNSDGGMIAMGMTDKSLCDSCTNIGCEFQSGIVRTECAFYMPPQLELDNCGNYVVQDSTTKNNIRDNRVKNELNRVKDELESTTKNCESCRYYGSHHEVCNYCYKCSLWTEQEPTTKNDLAVDCIDRVELLKAMNTYDKFGNDSNERLIFLSTPALQDRYVPYVHYDEMVNCVKGMPTVTPQQPNWIKCSEHLPNFDVDVLATTKEYGDVVKVTRWRTILKDCGWEWVLVDNIEGNAYNSDEIIAWMPLPQPYKAESEG